MVLHYTNDKATLHSISVDRDAVVEVFGDPDNASYEWRIVVRGVVEQHSDDGYGVAAIALQRGLNAYYGE